MAKKRRKRNAKIKSVKDIPYTKYRVDWIDIISESDWADEYEFDKMTLASPVNEGWLYEKTKNYIKLFASYDKDADGIAFGDRIMIPRSCVMKMTKI
jgi:hypothetical protein|tara:strand:- start:555 stop:845 length:291 start_codon:yes stop_codon:yes gene_type:complete